MPHATINGVSLFFDEHGSGEPVLFHHGYTGSHYSYDDVVPHLAKRYRTIRMDGRGAGDSDRSARGHSIEQYAADVIGMADHLGLEKFTYIGHSMGGVIGYELGLNYASRLDRLVLIAPAPADGVNVPASFRERAAKLHYGKEHAQMLEEAIILTAQPRSRDLVAARIQHALSVSDAHFEESWTALETYHKGDRLGEIKTPTLMVAGAADGLLPFNLADFQRLGNATLHVFSRVSHGIPYEIPDEFSAVVLDFLEHGVVTAATLQAKLREAMAPA
ncbi:MAG TPA: alpha/beta fold hydrolase [Tepidiformaceae bacterium]|nr:alpha/beta fold hydrolase [Tepidiformaceae bacterium]